MPARLLTHLKISDERVGRFVITCMALGFLALIAAGFAAAWSVKQNQVYTSRVQHTYEVARRLSYYQTLSERIETARRGMLLMSDPRFDGTANEAIGLLSDNVATIASLTRDNPRQHQRVERLRQQTITQIALVRRTQRLIRTSGIAAARDAFSDDGGLQLVAINRSLTRAMQREESALLLVRDAEQENSVRLFFMVLGLSGVLLVIVAVASLVVMRRSLSESVASRDLLRKMNTGLESAVAERTADLQRANDEIQRFAYIVSHDLRSPLVNVMGFTAELEAATQPLSELIDRVEADAPQLLTKEATLAVREDLPEAAGFIRSSTQKMDRLINAILKLSREGRRVLTPEPIDLVTLIDGVADTLAHRVDELGGEIAVARPLPELFHDRLAVEQIIANVVENAIKYRSPDRPIRVEVSAMREHRRVLIDIKDNGRGIEAKDLGRIFDLFRRSGLQNEPGEGIGLAHVRALAYRMGGTIECTSEFGQGSVFRLSLPARFEGEGGSPDE